MNKKVFMLQTRSIYAAHGLPARIADKDARKLLAKDRRKRARGRKTLARRGREAGAMLLAGVPEEEIRIMADAEPELRATWLAQMGHTVEAAQPPDAGAAPLGMDDDRYRLHTAAKQLADARCLANPRLDPGEAYALAAVELEDRKNGAIWLS
jgi:hypothetical protein